ncbi:DUF1010 domain-containing protein [Oryzisolibacter sp. LB2S]
MVFLASSACQASADSYEFSSSIPGPRPAVRHRPVVR